MKNILIVVLSLFIGLKLNAQQLEKGLLWEISGNGIEKPSYIFGTMHATCDATLDNDMLHCLNNVNTIYLEIDMDSPTLTVQMMMYSNMRNNTRISGLLSKEEFDMLNTFLKEEVGISATLLDTYKPVLIESLLLPGLLPCDMQSIELSLVKHAKSHQQEVYGLETVAEQLSVFDLIPYEEQVKSLMDIVKNGIGKSTTELETMLALYEAKDLNKLYEYVNAGSDPLYSGHTDVLLTDRNKNWMPKIEEAIKKQPVFFAVGAAHLAGPDGIIMLLRKNGYTVQAVTKQ